MVIKSPCRVCSCFKENIRCIENHKCEKIIQFQKEAKQYIQYFTAIDTADVDGYQVIDR